MTAEQLRYLCNKFARGKEQVTPTALFHGDNNQGTTPPSQKRKRNDLEAYYQQCEQAEDLTVLSQIRKKEKTESQGSCSGNIMDKGAGGPVSPSVPP